MNEGPLGVHEVELVVQSGPGLHDGGGVGETADCPHHFGQISARNHCWWLVVDPNLEPRGTPVDKLDGFLVFNRSNGSIDILGHNITSVQEATGHVFAMTGITLDHLVGRFETGIGDLSNRKLFMVSFLR